VITVAVIVVNHSRRELLRACLGSVASAAEASTAAIETIVVDNASNDRSIELTSEQFPQVRLIRNSSNVGFATAVNQGVAATDADWILLLNNDATIAPGALDLLVDAGGPPDVGAVAAQMRFAGDPHVINSAGIGVDALGVAFDRFLGVHIDDPEASRPSEVFGASGGAALYRRAMLEQIGGFDPTYFVYLEDVDVAWRAQQAGWRAVYVPRAVVHHHHAATAGHGSSFKYFHVGQNRMRLLARNMPTSRLLRHLPSMLLYDVAYVAFVGIRERTLAPMRGRLAGLRDWRHYRALGQATRRGVPLDRREGLAAALRRRSAWRSGGSAGARAG
jgi:GT2 family glycosyltransferase